MTTLEGQRALVTGASSGIGAEIARCLAREGADLVIVARRLDRLEALATELREAHACAVDVRTCDLSEPAAGSRLMDALEAGGATIDVLVNNAGFGLYDAFHALDWDAQRRMIAVNVTALTELTWRAVGPMVERGHGRVLNIASVAAWTPCPNFAVYAATKAYVRNFSEAVDHELRGTGVRVCVSCPGGTRTEFSDQAGQSVTASGEKTLMDAATCARISVDEMLGGRRMVVTGFMNAFSMWMMRWVPRRWMPSLVGKVMGSAVTKTRPKALPP